MSNALTAFGQISRALRNRNNIRLSDQADLMGLTVYEISRIERGIVQPDLQYAKKVSRALKADIISEQNLYKCLRKNPKVVPFPAQKTTRLFRKINKLSPTQIRYIRNGQSD